MKKVLVTRGRIRARINVPGVLLDINAADSSTTLREVRRIIDALSARQDDQIQIDTDWSRGWMFSEELRSTPQAMEFIRQASRAEQGTLYRKICLDNMRVVDTFKKENYCTIDSSKTRETLQANLSDFNPDLARFGLVHIMSTISSDDKALLVDMFRKRFPKAELKTQFTHKDVLGKTVIELILFGPFPREEF